MLRQSSLAFSTATLVALVATGALRRIALGTGFVDRPGDHKSHRAAVPYLGGVAIAGASFAGWLFEPRLGGHIALVAVVAAGITLIGLADDAAGLGAWARLLAEMAAAVTIVWSGVRAEP
ncbi:MAG TPA: undecaprenyl/decaprenyl-phosphate alpha-N-acetylglucosaminyl 1-phosphate transferase, partial [Acidimicrobiia bacterium]|nr:undecaprenyl/decaprenyl-phosphate alpha-N-acetylglucosaminyl 1-phosphate transferase [Acidimicrobiia bacterium]